MLLFNMKFIMWHVGVVIMVPETISKKLSPMMVTHPIQITMLIPRAKEEPVVARASAEHAF